MTILSERDIQFDFSSALRAWRFDTEGQGGHGLTHCMKAVDFVVELEDHYLFVEVKDPEAAPDPHSIDKAVDRFSHGDFDEDLKYKYRDSFLYEWAHGRADKPVYYYVLFCSNQLDAANLTQRTDVLGRNLPLTGPRQQPWTRPFVHDCAIFDIAAWNQHLAQYPVIRLSATP